MKYIIAAYTSMMLGVLVIGIAVAIKMILLAKIGLILIGVGLAIGLYVTIYNK